MVPAVACGSGSRSNHSIRSLNGTQGSRASQPVAAARSHPAPAPSSGKPPHMTASSTGPPLTTVRGR